MVVVLGLVSGLRCGFVSVLVRGFGLVLGEVVLDFGLGLELLLLVLSRDLQLWELLVLL
jgi:hypothetical protein